MHTLFPIQSNPSPQGPVGPEGWGRGFHGGALSLCSGLWPVDTPCCGAPGWVLRSEDRTNASRHEMTTGMPSAIPISFGRLLRPLNTPHCGAPGWVIRSEDRTDASRHELTTGMPSTVPGSLG